MSYRLTIEFSEHKIVKCFEESHFSHDIDFSKSMGGGVTQYACDSVNFAYHNYRLGFIKAAYIANKLLLEVI